MADNHYSSFARARNYTQQYELDSVDSIVTKQEDGYLGYISAGEFATTGSNIFIGGQILMGNLTVVGGISANTYNVETISVSHYSASTNFGLDTDDIHTFTGSVKITGSLDVIGSTTTLGNTIISGGIFVSGGINGQINATNGVISGSAQISSFGFVSGSYETTGRGIISSSAQIAALLGWGRYDDTRYTTSSFYTLLPVSGAVTLPNNGGNTIEPYTNISFYDTGSQRIQVENINDVYMCTVTFKAKTANANSAYMRVQMDSVGPTTYERVGKDLFFGKGNEIWHTFHDVFQYYADSDFVTYGNRWKIQAFDASVNISNVIFFIQRTHNTSI